jgi:hypothetical protein
MFKAWSSIWAGLPSVSASAKANGETACSTQSETNVRRIDGTILK